MTSDTQALSKLFMDVEKAQLKIVHIYEKITELCNEFDPDPNAALTTEAASEMHPLDVRVRAAVTGNLYAINKTLQLSMEILNRAKQVCVMVNPHLDNVPARKM